MTIDKLKKEAAEIRDMQTESGNTAKKVGTEFVGIIEYAETQITTAQTTAADAVKAANTNATAIANEATTRANADATEVTNRNTAIDAARAELLKRILGVSDSSNGYTDPFINGGTYEDTDTMLAAVAAHPLQTESESSKYAGNVRYDMQGVIYEVHNHPIHYDSSEWVQSISGPLELNSDGTLVRSGQVYATFFRYHNSDGWTAWKKIDAVDSEAVHHVTLSYDASARRLYALQYDADGNRLADYTDPSGNTYYVDLLLAGSARPGLMSIADKVKLDAYPSYADLLATIAALEKRIAALEAK